MQFKFTLIGIWALAVSIIWIFGIITQNNNVMWFVAGGGAIFGIYIFIISCFPKARKVLL